MQHKRTQDQKFLDLIDMIHFTEQLSSQLCGILDAEDIFRIIAERFRQSGKYSMSILWLSEDRQVLRLIRNTLAVKEEIIREGETATGLKLKHTHIALQKSSIYRRVITEAVTLQVKVDDIIRELLPGPLAGIVVRIFNYRNRTAIISPLKIHDKVVGAFAMSSHELSEYLVPSVKNLVKHICSAMELSSECAERRRLKQLLSNNERKYRALVEDMPVLMCRFTLDGTLTFVNAAYCAYFSKKSSELLGQNFFQFIPEEDRERVKKQYLHLDEEHPYITYEHQVLDRAGNKRWQQWTDRALFSSEGQIEEYQSIGIDITQIKEYELRINRLKSAIEQSIDGIAICDLQGEVLYINTAFARMHGWPRPEIIGKKAESLHAPDHTLAFQAKMMELQQQGAWQGEIQHKRLDGTLFPVFVSATLLKDNKGNPDGIIVIVKDISYIVRTKAELERKNIALKELLSQIEAEKQEIKERVTENMDKLIQPLFLKLKNRCGAHRELLGELEQLETSLQDICSPFIKRVIGNHTNLTPRELEICTLVKKGMTNKEIAQSLSVSVSTVVKHRQFIRKKFGLTGKAINLFSYLHDLDE